MTREEKYKAWEDIFYKYFIYKSDNPYETGSNLPLASVNFDKLSGFSGDGIIEATIWPDALVKFQDLIVKDQQVAILGKKDGDDKIIVDKIKSYDTWLKDVRKKFRKNIF